MGFDVAGFTGGPTGGSYQFFDVTISPNNSAFCSFQGGLQPYFQFNSSSGLRTVHCLRKDNSTNTIYITVQTSVGVLGPALIPGILPPTEADRLQASFTAQLTQLQSQISQLTSNLSAIQASLNTYNTSQLTGLKSGSFCVLQKGSTCPAGFIGGQFFTNFNTEPSSSTQGRSCVVRNGDTGLNFFNVDGNPTQGVSSGCNSKVYMNLSFCCAGAAVSSRPSGS